MPGRTLLFGAVGAAALAALGQLDASAEPAPERASASELERARKATLAMRATAGDLSKRASAARRGKDFVKFLCLADKSERVELATETAEERLEALKEAERRKDQERQRHEVGVIGELSTQVKALASAADSCLGKDLEMAEDSELSFEIDPFIPDPFDIDAAADLMNDPPPVSSPIG